MRYCFKSCYNWSCGSQSSLKINQSVPKDIYKNKTPVSHKQQLKTTWWHRLVSEGSYEYGIALIQSLINVLQLMCFKSQQGLQFHSASANI